MESKSWLQSRTIWVNLIGGIIGFLPMIDINILTALGVSNPAKYFAIISIVMGFLNVVLRSITTKPIKRRKPKVQKESEGS